MTLIALSDSQRLAGAGQDSARSKSDASAEVVVRFRDASTFSSGYESLYKRWESFVRGSLGGDEGPGGPCGHLCSDLVFLVDHQWEAGIDDAQRWLKNTPDCQHSRTIGEVHQIQCKEVYHA